MRDIIDTLVGIPPGSRLDRIRAGRRQARENAQNSYLALFEPATPGGFGLGERFAVAAFVAGLHGEPAARDFYAAELARHADASVVAAVADEVAAGTTLGPYGAYPAGPLSREDIAGPQHRVDATRRTVLGERLSAALDHAHLLVFHPRDAEPAALQRLLDAGLTTTEIVTLSQLVAFLSFQIRVVAGLKALDAAGEAA
jgi:CMD domain protein